MKLLSGSPPKFGPKTKASMARWYIIHAYSGFEGKVRDAIMAEATRMGLEQLVEPIEVPTETITEARRGKKVRSNASSCPAMCSPSSR